MKRTAQQNTRLYALISRLGLAEDDKTQLVMQYTEGRTGRSSEMTADECNNLINALQKQIKPSAIPASRQALNNQRRQLMSRAIEAGYYKEQNGKPVCDVNALQSWIDKYGAVKKPLNSLSKQDLIRLIKQMTVIRDKRIQQ